MGGFDGNCCRQQILKIVHTKQHVDHKSLNYTGVYLFTYPRTTNIVIYTSHEDTLIVRKSIKGTATNWERGVQVDQSGAVYVEDLNRAKRTN